MVTMLRCPLSILAALIMPFAIASCSGNQGTSGVPPTLSNSPSTSAQPQMPPGLPPAFIKQIQEGLRGNNIGTGFPIKDLRPVLSLKDGAPLTGLRPNPASGTMGFSNGSGAAAGGFINALGLVQLGPLAAIGNGCTTQSGTVAITGINLPPLVTGGAAQSTLTNFSHPGATGTSLWTSITNPVMLNGLIKADLIQSTSYSVGFSNGTLRSVDHDPLGHVSSVAGLVVAGIHINVTPAPNTKMNLPGLGTVTLNEQIHVVSNGNTYLTVTMVHVKVTVAPNPFGLPVGADIYLARAFTDFLKAGDAVGLLGAASGPAAFVIQGTKVVQIGPVSSEGIRCTGGSAHAQAATVTLPGILNAGTSTQDSSGNYSGGDGFVFSQTTLANVNALVNTIVINSINSASFVGTNGINQGYTQIIGGAVGLIKLPVNPAPNTVISVPPLLKIILNEQHKILTSTESGLTIIPVRIILLAPIPPLSTGTQILLGVEIADAVKF